MSLRRLASVVSLLLAGAIPAALAQAPGHPLDALTGTEYWSVFDVLKASGKLSATSRYASVNLAEPPKSDLLAWQAGQPFGRRALAVVRQEKDAFEALVDLRERRLVSWTKLEGVQPNVTAEEMKTIADAIKEQPDWQAAMKRRGLADFETVDCFAAVLGNFDTAPERGRRLVRVSCWDRHGAWGSQGRPIEGVVGLVDYDTRKLVQVVDTGEVPLPRDAGDYDENVVGRVREVPSPIGVSQPGGPAYRLDGWQVSWQNWRFHFRIDPRMGTVVSMVRYDDAGRQRSVLFQGALTEIFVPYTDPSEGWYFVNFLDVGEHYDGLATPLERGTDCPEHARFFDSVLSDDRGMPKRRPRAACLFEREPGDPAWRHLNGADQIESRTRRDLVLRMIATIGNYDYLVDWVFQQDGTIKVAAGATGQVNVKAVAAKTPAAASSEAGGKPRSDAFGRFISENLVAVNHDHFLSFRLDLDVDGPKNSFVIDRLKPQRLADGSPRRSTWTVQSDVVKTEQAGRLHMHMDKPTLWRVVNPAASGPLGYPTSFELKPGHSAISLFSPDDNPQLRGGFSQYCLWVTAYSDKERYAAGPYPTGARVAGGLPVWAAADRPVENTDIVVWYTMGMHHVPRAEDWPVMPTAWHEFELRPFDFFPRNPALDLPPR